MRPTPPGPTLFPYTTLFRSPWEAVEKRRYWRGRLRTFSCRFRAELMPTAMRWLPILSLTGLVCAVAFSDKWLVKFTDAAANAGLPAVNITGSTTNKKYNIQLLG